MALKVIELFPTIKCQPPSSDRLKDSCFSRVVRSGKYNMPRQVKNYLLESLESPDGEFSDHRLELLRLSTTKSSLPRSSITLTAIWPSSPASNGAGH